MKWILRGLYKAFSRRKVVDTSQDTTLARVLSTVDLTALGIGSTLGVGVYVLAGSVAKNHAGPAVIISFAIAAVASMFAGLCYAEFGARVPRAGSAYIYSYVTMGEFVAFLMGWTLILEYVIGSASVVRALSTYVDVLFEDSMKKFFESVMPIHVDSLSSYPDFFALGVTLIFSAALAFGAKESSVVNNVFTLVNLCVVLFVIIAGSLKADINNWKIESNCTETKVGRDCEIGEGGFMPYGVSGIITGAATCFYGFIGFDCVATTGEEAKNPQRSIPIAIVASLTIVFLAYFGVSVVLTTVLPYYDQNASAPFPHMFLTIGWNWATYFVTIGAISGLCASLLGSMFPLPRVIYAMSSDGLIFQWMGNINSRFQTPIMGTLSAGLLTGILATLFELEPLVKLMSICTLLTYSIVASCVLILRYEESKAYEKKGDRNPRPTFAFIIKQLVSANKLNHSTKLTGQIVTALVLCYVILCICTATLLSMYMTEIGEGNVSFIVPLVVLVVALLITLCFIYLQPVSDKKLTFSVPLVPFLPGFSILINVYLMMTLDANTWMQFSIWIAIGLAIYFLYGVWHSHIRQRKLSSISTDNDKDKDAIFSRITIKRRIKNTQDVESPVTDVCFALQSPDKEALVAAERLRQYDKSVALRQQKQLSQRQNMMFAIITKVKGWDLPQFLMMGQDQRTAIRKALNEDADKLLSEGDSSDPQLRRLKQEMADVNRLFDDFEKRARAEEKPTHAGRLFNDQVSSLQQKLDEVERILNARIAVTLPRDLYSLEHLVLQHKDYERNLQCLAPDVEEMQQTFRGITLKTPAMMNRLDNITTKWNHLWDLSNLYNERLKCIEIVLSRLKKNMIAISKFEIKLASFDELPSDVKGLQSVLKNLTVLQNAIAQRRVSVDQLKEDAYNARRLVERSRPNHRDPHGDMDRLDAEVNKLNARWTNACRQLDDRLSSAETTYTLAQQYQNLHRNEVDLVDENLQKIRTKVYEELVEQGIGHARWQSRR